MSVVKRILMMMMMMISLSGALFLAEFLLHLFQGSECMVDSFWYRVSGSPF